jgi:hypothetical protein
MESGKRTVTKKKYKCQRKRQVFFLFSRERCEGVMSCKKKRISTVIQRKFMVLNKFNLNCDLN